MDQNDRLIKTKENWAKARRGGEEREVFYEGDDRLPPGQHLVGHGRCSTLARSPIFRLPNGRSPSEGAVAAWMTWTWTDFLAQPQFKDISDFHCVTSWSRYDK